KPSRAFTAGVKSRKGSSPKSSSTPSSPNPSRCTACCSIAAVDAVSLDVAEGARYIVPLLQLSYGAVILRPFEQLGNRHLQSGVYRFRRNFRQRHQHEPPQ